MSVPLRRLAFGCFWCGVFWIALLTIGGGIAASMASQPATTQTAIRPGEGVSRPVDVAAGVEFRERYGWHVALGAVLLAAAGTFTGILPGTRRK
jgi:hypothetical protein